MHTPAKDQAKNRIGHLDSDKIAKRLPDVEPFSYLTELFIKSGMALNTGNGVSALTWQEIESFVKCSGIPLTNWESDTIKRMSAIYASAVVRYTDENVESPYQSVEDKLRLAQEIQSAFKDVKVKEKYGLSNNQNIG